jgi:transposase
MSATYRAAIRTGLPHAIVLVDHFHVVQVRREALCYREGWKDPPPGCRSSSVKLTAV